MHRASFWLMRSSALVSDLWFLGHYSGSRLRTKCGGNVYWSTDSMRGGVRSNVFLEDRIGPKGCPSPAAWTRSGGLYCGGSTPETTSATDSLWGAQWRQDLGIVLAGSYQRLSGADNSCFGFIEWSLVGGRYLFSLRPERNFVPTSVDLLSPCNR